MDADQRVAVAALEGERKVEIQRHAPVAFGHDARTGGKHVVEDELTAEPCRVSIGGSRKSRSYASPAAAASRRARSASPRRTSASRPSAPRLAFSAFSAAGARSTNVARAAPRDSASMPSAPRAGEEVEHDGAGHVAQHAEQRFAHAVRRRAGQVARRRDEPAAPERAGDDPHAASGSASALGQARTEQRVVGRAELRVGGQDLGGAGVRAIEDLRVLGQPRGTRSGRGRIGACPSAPPPPVARDRSRRAGSRRRARPAPSAARLGRTEQQQQRRLGAAADAAAQLVQLLMP